MPFGLGRSGKTSSHNDRVTTSYTQADGGNVANALPMFQPGAKAGSPADAAFDHVPMVQATPIPAPVASAPAAAIAPMAPERIVISADASGVAPPQSPKRRNPLLCQPATEWDDVTLGRHPTNMARCPSCSRINVRTRVTTYPSLLSWLFSITIFILCWPVQFMPGYMIVLAGLPFCWDKLKRSDHYCSKCDRRVGSVEPFSDCGVKHHV